MASLTPPVPRRGATIWFTGLSGSGKSTIADLVATRLLQAGLLACRLDGDRLRKGLSSDLGFGRSDREENVRRVAHVAALLAGTGVVAVVSLISPYSEGRRRARALHEQAGINFCEVFVATPVEECERRDPKGLYARARAGLLSGLSGVDDPYERPEHPDLVLAGPEVGVEEAAGLALALLSAHIPLPAAHIPLPATGSGQGRGPAGELGAFGWPVPFASSLGIEITSAHAGEVRAHMAWRQDLCTADGMLHGGAIMALADTTGASCAFLNLPEGAAGTATVESKTNFLRPVRAGWIEARSRAIHAGGTLIVVETDVTDSEQRLAARVTQTQIFLRHRPARAAGRA